ncbi:MAG: type II toxin-antitoxin system RelE/ParE family toxin [Kiritimatiellae bacterium]|nr:type II toxin-antitoxin system RelE/ParE family toxin [Kiritimatiellia bacterium]MCO5044605.1 type II toxin-antitoxin system RelE/ParE family toxin [Kiritimatiellia bacterium]MCO5060967.1 type II toxin-antitoxin system RelE/ParE family toxin [Kiritimatiellia bacterium]MCO5068119.1 type II toxin-antitoxin system RelE/ParE family toxin [Kiritimatiellia bacterium]
MSFKFHPEAEEELISAVAYYEGVERGLGLDFSREVYASVQNAADYPTIWPTIDPEIRRCLVHRFPYGVLYSIEPTGIFIIAVMHLHRDPGYWKQRNQRGGT